MGKVIKCIVVILVVLAAGCKKEAAQNMNTPKEGSTIRRKILPEFSDRDFDNWPDDKKFHAFMHSRPFWIRDSDTLGVIHPSDMEIHRYFKAAPFIVPSAIAGNSTRGSIIYSVNYVPPDNYMPDGGITIDWFLLPLDTLGFPVKYTSDELFQFATQASWDTSTEATFKDCTARVYSQNIPFYYAENSFYMLYQTCVFFERKGVLFRIEATCQTKPQFLGPSSDWWRWLEAHWMWMGEPHPDWSRYPIPRDNIRYPGRGE